MKLFFLPGSCSLVPHILFNELGMKYELEKMDKADRTSVLKFNPKGLVPTLVTDDERPLTEVASILQYLADLKPEANLVPKAGTWERYKCQEWLNYVATELHKTVGALFNKDFDENARTVFRKTAEKKLQWLDEQILSKNQYLMGSSISLPDFYAYVIMGWTKHVGIDFDQFSNLVAYRARISERPAVKAALQAESALK